MEVLCLTVLNWVWALVCITASRVHARERLFKFDPDKFGNVGYTFTKKRNNRILTQSSLSPFTGQLVISKLNWCDN